MAGRGAARWAWSTRQCGADRARARPATRRWPSRQRLLRTAEVFDRAPEIEDEPVIAQHDLYAAIWREAVGLRDGGQLPARGRAIRCPVLLMQGQYDARPAASFSAALASALSEFKAVVLPHCSHHRWLERRARELFFDHRRRALD